MAPVFKNKSGFRNYNFPFPIPIQGEFFRFRLQILQFQTLFSVTPLLLHQQSFVYTTTSQNEEEEREGEMFT